MKVKIGSPAVSGGVASIGGVSVRVNRPSDSGVLSRVVMWRLRDSLFLILRVRLMLFRLMSFCCGSEYCRILLLIIIDLVSLMLFLCTGSLLIAGLLVFM